MRVFRILDDTIDLDVFLPGCHRAKSIRPSSLLHERNEHVRSTSQKFSGFPTKVPQHGSSQQVGLVTSPDGEGAAQCSGYSSPAAGLLPGAPSLWRPYGSTATDAVRVPLRVGGSHPVNADPQPSDFPMPIRAATDAHRPSSCWGIPQPADLSRNCRFGPCVTGKVTAA